MGKDWYDGCVADRWWRLNHLYCILTKEDGIVRFKPNWAQEKLYRGLWHRNIILKARQLGMSTFSAIMMLDHCLHKPNFQAGIIDKTEPDAKGKINKIRLAYETLARMPESFPKDHVKDPEDRAKIQAYASILADRIKAKINAENAEFSNGSAIRSGSSLRGDTLHFLHVSEFGYIANKQPDRALEVLSGGVNTVSQNNIVIMESTHEGGKYGENYRLMKNAMEQQGKKLSPLDYKFFFFPWWQQKEYAIEGQGHDSAYDQYFNELKNAGIELTEAQKRWYCTQSKTFGYRVKTEYPSTPDEAFATRVEGSIYGSLISRRRAEGCVAVPFEADPYAPLYVSWDIGLSDYMALWLIQTGGDGKFYVLDYYCANEKELPHYFNVVKGWERKFGSLITMNLLPHDAAQRDHMLVSFDQKVRNAGFPCVVVPRTDSVWKGVYAAKEILPSCVFHERCSRPVQTDEGREYMSGLDALENYQMGGVGANGTERKNPLHNACSHGADAFRVFAEAYAAGYVTRIGARRMEHKPPVLPKQERIVDNGVPGFWM